MQEGIRFLMDEQKGQALKSFRSPPFKSKRGFVLPAPVHIRQNGADIDWHHAVNCTTIGKTPPEAENKCDQTPMKNHPEFATQHATTAYGRRGTPWHETIKKKALVC